MAHYLFISDLVSCEVSILLSSNRDIVGVKFDSKLTFADLRQRGIVLYLPQNFSFDLVTPVFMDISLL